MFWRSVHYAFDQASILLKKSLKQSAVMLNILGVTVQDFQPMFQNKNWKAYQMFPKTDLYCFKT